MTTEFDTEWSFHLTTNTQPQLGAVGVKCRTACPHPQKFGKLMALLTLVSETFSSPGTNNIQNRIGHVQTCKGKVRYCHDRSVMEL